MKHLTRTKIVATIGPASDTVAKLEHMIKSGMTVARLNFSHGTHSSHAKLIKNIRKAAKNAGTEIAILQDLQGPRIRVGDLPEEGVEVKKKQKVAFVTESRYIKGSSNPVMMPVQYEGLYKDVKKGDEILIEDGTKKFKVLQVRNRTIFCKVIVPGTIKSHKGINVPGVTLTVAVITDKDKKDIVFGQKHAVDYVALSFVKDASDIKKLKQLIRRAQKKSVKIPTQTIAKVERQEALDNLDAIIKEVDGIMVARGDLGLEIPAEEVPLWQKGIIRKCLENAKPVIVATQMLDSMISNPRPTRAEVSDVANAVIDHTDAVMLSGESAAGKYPDKAVSMMTKIAIVTEASKYDDSLCGPQKVKGRHEGVALAACHLYLHTKAKAAIVFTRSGDSARLLSRHRPELTILALTPELKTQRQLALSWGVLAKKVAPNASTQTMMKNAIKYLKENKITKNGDHIIIAGSDPFGKVPEMNHVRVIEVGEKF